MLFIKSIFIFYKIGWQCTVLITQILIILFRCSVSEVNKWWPTRLSWIVSHAVNNIYGNPAVSIHSQPCPFIHALSHCRVAQRPQGRKYVLLTLPRKRLPTIVLYLLLFPLVWLFFRVEVFETLVTIFLSVPSRF